MIRLRVSDHRLDGLATLEQPLLVLAQRLEFSSVNDLHVLVVRVGATVAEVDNDLLGRTSVDLQRGRGLLEPGAASRRITALSAVTSRVPWVTGRMRCTVRGWLQHQVAAAHDRQEGGGLLLAAFFAPVPTGRRIPNGQDALGVLVNRVLTCSDQRPVGARI
jgi:hypothetical protein